MSSSVEWVALQPEIWSEQFSRLTQAVSKAENHWSRWFEYPWVILNGDFKKEDTVLDAAGGDGLLQCILGEVAGSVYNVDYDQSQLDEATKRFAHATGFKNVTRVVGNLEELKFHDDHFDKIVCASVLEHIHDIRKVLKELWRVLKPGGRLLVTMDVAAKWKENHTIDMEIAAGILDMFGLAMPAFPKGLIGISFMEGDQNVELKVLCFYVDKPEVA